MNLVDIWGKVVEEKGRADAKALGWVPAWLLGKNKPVYSSREVRGPQSAVGTGMEKGSNRALGSMLCPAVGPPDAC